MDNEKTYKPISETLASNTTDIYSTVIKNDSIYQVTGVGTQTITSPPTTSDVVNTSTGAPSYEVPKMVKVKKYRLYKESAKNGNGM
nr:hypothetical protein [Clostridia bacterium]